jgi:hypothetical protein
MGATLKVLFPYFIKSLQNRARAASDITPKALIAWDLEQNDSLLAATHQCFMKFTIR